MTDASDRTMGNIRKNYVINRTQNYYIQRNSSHNNYPLKHNQDVQTLPGPTIKIINMAAERITDDPSKIFLFLKKLIISKIYRL